MERVDYTDYPLLATESEGKKQFELHVGEYFAYVEYMVVRGNVMYVTHTEVPMPLEGKGVGSAIVGRVLQYIRDHDMLLAPICPFLASYLQRHPEAASGILAPGFKIG